MTLYKILTIYLKGSDDFNMLEFQHTAEDESLCQAEFQYSEVCQILDRLDEFIGKTSIENNQKLAEHPRVKSWLNELEKLKAKKDLPKTVIAVVGKMANYLAII